MVRRGSTVRVRQRASDFLLLEPFSVGWAGDGALLKCPRDVHLVDVRFVWPAVAVKEVDRVVASVAGEVSVVAIDHCQAGTHVAGEVEGRDAGTQCEGRERVPEIVDAAQRHDARRDLGWFPGSGCGSCGSRSNRREDDGKRS